MESVTRLGTGSRIAHAIADVDNVESIEDKANGNVPGRAAESNARNDDTERTVKAGISKNDLKTSIKDEVFETTGQSGLESANTSVNGIGSSLTNGNPLNRLDTNGNGVVGLKSELHNGGNSIKTLVESPVKKLLDPATAG